MLISRREAGFTLIEIMVVLVIIAILGALIAPQILGQVDEARVTAAKQDIRTLGTALDFYKLDNFRYPTTDQGLRALVEKPDDPSVRNWRAGGYLKSTTIPKDPWGNDRMGFVATTSIDRKQFGLGWNQVLEAGGVLVGDRVDIELEVQAVKAAAAQAA